MIGTGWMNSAARTLLVAMVLSTTLGACADDRAGGLATGYNDPLNRDLATRNHRFSVTVAEGAAVGGAAGALVGGVAGMASGAGGGGEAALVGLAVGLVVGAAAGVAAAFNNEEYATHEAALSGQIQQTRALVLQYQRDVAATRRLVATQVERIEGLQERIAAGDVSAEKYRSQIAEAASSVDLIRDNLSQNEQIIQLIQEAIEEQRDDGMNTTALDAELDRYRHLRDQQLDLLNELLASQSG